MKENIMSKKSSELVVGRMYFFRHPGADSYVGRLVAIVNPFEAHIEEASWVANSGRLSEFIKYGKSQGMEIEVVGEVMRVRYQSIVVWDHPPFTESV